MSATMLLTELKTAGVTVNATQEGILELDAPRGVLTEDKLDALRKHKSEIIAELHNEEARRLAFFRELGRDPVAWREFETQMNEHAAFMELNGGLTRTEALTHAEIVTYEDWVN